MSHPELIAPWLVAVRIAFIAAPAVHRRGRPRRLVVILIGGRLVLAVRRAPAPDATIAVRVGPRPGTTATRGVTPGGGAVAVGMVAVFTGVAAAVAIAPLDIFAFDKATLVDEARSRT